MTSTPSPRDVVIRYDQPARRRPVRSGEPDQCPATLPSGYRCRKSTGHPPGPLDGGHRNEDLTW